MPKIRYEIDPHNRLILKSGKKSGLRRFRKILDGRFKTDENNTLSYHIKAPRPGEESIPHQVRLKGKWSLTGDHELSLAMNKLGRQTLGDKITLRAEILDVKANSILFAVTTKTKKNTKSTYILNLKGRWRADKNNRLSFWVKKEKGAYDILTFNGAWEINRRNEIIYQYERAELIRKRKRAHTLTFKGRWDIEDKLRISYVLNKDTNSAFRFKTAAGVFKEGYIKYELGIGISGKSAPVRRAVVLFGRWKIKKGVGLLFEVEYENKKMRAIVFAAEAGLTNRDTILFKLKKDIENRDIGVNLEISRKTLKGDGEAFIRALKSGRESSIYAGTARRW